MLSKSLWYNSAEMSANVIAKRFSNEELREVARTIRRDIVCMTYAAAAGHAGGPLSAADYITSLFFNYLRIDPKNPGWERRDRFILSNGHCSALNYAVLARRGFFDPSYLLTFRSTGSKLQGHPNMRKLTYLEASTGSLGQGLSIAHGMALGARLAGYEEVRVFCNCGDGELQEGNIWEAVWSAGHYKSDNLKVMVDWNNNQIDGTCTKVKNLDPLPDKFKAFNFHVIVADGHDFDQIHAAFDEAVGYRGKPTVILFKTIMMKGVKSYEDNFLWHGKPLNREELAIALRELGFDQTPEEAITEISSAKAPVWD